MNIKEIQTKPTFTLITNNAELQRICTQAAEKPVIALDTEFVRIRSYYPKLGLIQLYDGEQVSLIDPVEITDFTPFQDLLANPNVLKVLQACYEDLEVFQYYFAQLPQPMLDTQIMANFLGFPNSTGLATLIQHYFNVQIDKGASRTDWLARPLSETQLHYAAADVWYLLPLYQQMQQHLAQTPWQQAVAFDCALLLEKRVENKDPDLAYLAIPNAWKLLPQELNRLKLLAKWRQNEAIKRDLALNFVVRGENLWQAAKQNAKHTSELLNMGFSSQEVRIHGKKILQILEQSKRIAEQDYPTVIVRLADEPKYKKTLKSLQQRLKQLAPPNLAAEVIASKRELENLMKWVWLQDRLDSHKPSLMRDWREPFGLALLACFD